MLTWSLRLEVFCVVVRDPEKSRWARLKRLKRKAPEGPLREAVDAEEIEGWSGLVPMAREGLLLAVGWGIPLQDTEYYLTYTRPEIQHSITRHLLGPKTRGIPSVPWTQCVMGWAIDRDNSLLYSTVVDLLCTNLQ